MFVYSMKASTLKFFGVIAASVAVLIVLIALIPTYDAGAATAGADAIRYNKIKTNDDRLTFLSQFGWEAVQQPIEEKQVRIPADFDRILEKYNSLQLDQGLDLSKYKRKTLTRYTYQITNFPDYEGTVYANILVYRGRVVAGDLCSAASDGFVCGFEGK